MFEPRQRVISNQLAVVENLHESLKEMFFSRKICISCTKHIFSTIRDERLGLVQGYSMGSLAQKAQVVPNRVKLSGSVDHTDLWTSPIPVFQISLLTNIYILSIKYSLIFPYNHKNQNVRGKWVLSRILQIERNKC